MKFIRKFIDWFQLRVLGRNYFIGIDFCDGLKTSQYGYWNRKGQAIMTKTKQEKVVKWETGIQ